MPDLLIAPYLPLSSTATIGPWELLPSRDVAESPALPGELRDEVLRLIVAYRPTTGLSMALGAVLRPEGDQIGAPFDRATARVLRHALLAGAVANNPTMAVSAEEQSENAGHATMTSENALLYGHPLGQGVSYVIGTGAIVHTMAARYAPAGKPMPKIAPPGELPPVLFASFDAEVADGAFSVLTREGTPSRRLARALDWYRIAMSNADSIRRSFKMSGAF